MVQDLLGVALALVLALVTAGPLSGALRKHPWVFYLLAAAYAGVYLFYCYSDVYEPGLQFLMEPIRKGYLASFFLATVMFVGTMPEKSALRRHLQPIRAEMSVLSLILYMGHIFAFLPSYLPRLGALMQRGNLMSASIVVALVLTFIYMVLGVLSFKVFRVKMPYRIWKGIQRCSYLMMLLLVVHIWLALGRSALKGATVQAVTPIVVYTTLVGVYAVLRIRRAVLDHRKTCAAATAA